MMDVLIGMTLLSFVVLSVMNVFLGGLAQARDSSLRDEATVWVQAELEYLRGLGYSHSCLAGAAAPAVSTRVIPSGAPCTALEPPLRAGFVEARVHIENDVLGRPGLKRLTVAVFRTPGAVFYHMVTYATQFE